MIKVGGITMDTTGSTGFLAEQDLAQLAEPVTQAARQLADRTCPGSGFLGWLDLPEKISDADLAGLQNSAEQARGDSDAYVVVGIGGSYLGARAVLASLGRDGVDDAHGPEVLFAGTGLCPVTLQRVLAKVADRDFRLCVISKSGTTLEPAIAFRVLRDELVRRYGRQQASSRITAVTDSSRGALRQLADAEGYETFVIPDDVGGRFSVLTPVGLVPLAVAGVDIRALVGGAVAMRHACQVEDMFRNPAHLYAANRYGLHQKGYTTEVMSTFHPDLQMIQEWWKQLFGESEGKDGRGIFPASTVFTTDLHSLGQFIQDGPRHLQETFLCVRSSGPEMVVPVQEGADGNLDGLDYLAGRQLDEINWKAYEGTRKAHIAGGVPCTSFVCEQLDAGTIGGLIYLFEKAVAVSGLLQGVNPFDQPGVETYKREMFDLLGKP